MMSVGRVKFGVKKICHFGGENLHIGLVGHNDSGNSSTLKCFHVVGSVNTVDFTLWRISSNTTEKKATQPISTAVTIGLRFCSTKFFQSSNLNFLAPDVVDIVFKRWSLQLKLFALALLMEKNNGLHQLACVISDEVVWKGFELCRKVLATCASTGHFDFTRCNICRKLSTSHDAGDDLIKMIRRSRFVSEWYYFSILFFDAYFWFVYRYTFFWSLPDQVSLSNRSIWRAIMCLNNSATTCTSTRKLSVYFLMEQISGCLLVMCHMWYCLLEFVMWHRFNNINIYAVGGVLVYR